LGYNQSNAGGAISVGHHLVELVYGTLNYGYEKVHIFDVTTAAPELVIEQAAVNGGYSETSAVTLTLSRSTLDSADPTRGLAATANFEYAGGFLGGSNNFIKTNLDLSQYFPLGWRLVGHLHGNIAYAEAFGDTPFLPVQERYYLGGLTSVRGYKNYTISPRSPVTDNPEGGTKAYYLQSEVFFPLYDPVKMRGIVFLDAGNAFAEGTPYNFTVRVGAGVGIMFTSPLGQIVLELGIPLNPQHSDRPYVLHFTAGKAF
jgi:outer membrane protein insertion porin family